MFKVRRTLGGVLRILKMPDKKNALVHITGQLLKILMGGVLSN